MIETVLNAVSRVLYVLGLLWLPTSVLVVIGVLLLER